MLSTAVRKQMPQVAEVDSVYKSAYPKHPMTIWVGDSYRNFVWAYEHGVEINKQYQYRFGKIHKSERILDIVKFMLNDICESFGKENKIGSTPVPLCMPDTYKWCDNHVDSYREYYFHDKQYFAKWEKGMRKPQWFKNMEAKHGCQ
tara:strand:+ start:1074 stop:1511 length:438 start_codon:yes stop_codon:yes gene_type:complete